MAVDATRNLLAKHILFKGLSSDILDGITEISATKSLGDRTILFLKGDTGTGLYGVLSGKVKISIDSPSGKELIIGFMEPGDIFGEIALFDGKPRTANATVVGPTRLLSIPHRDFIPFLEKKPEVFLYFMNLVCERLRATNQVLEDSSFLELPERLAKKLVDLTEKSRSGAQSGAPSSLKLSQQELGKMMGISRESINKQLQVWRKKGWVELERGQIVIHDLEALQCIAF